MTDRPPRPPLPHDPRLVKDELKRRIRDVLDWLGVREAAVAGVVMPLNPRRNDRKPGSFVIWTEGDGAGAFRDYAIEGVQGDVWDLIRYLARLPEWIDAYWWALDKLGWGRGVVRTIADDREARERAAADRMAREAREEADRAAKATGLFTWWLGLERIEGTPAERYLTQGRGIPLDRLGAPIKSLRFSPRQLHVSEEVIDRETGEVLRERAETHWPCMVAAGTRGRNVTGLHYTWLTPDGLAKAPVTPAKKMRGDWRGGTAIRLTNGAGNLTPSKAAKEGHAIPLIIGEGIETTGTAAVARPDFRAWAAATLGGMGRIEWPACASAVILLRDNDWKAEAVAAFKAVETHWTRQARGRPLKVVASAVGSDFNDWGRGG